MAHVVHPSSGLPRLHRKRTTTETRNRRNCSGISLPAMTFQPRSVDYRKVWCFVHLRTISPRGFVHLITLSLARALNLHFHRTTNLPPTHGLSDSRSPINPTVDLHSPHYMLLEEYFTFRIFHAHPKNVSTWLSNVKYSYSHIPMMSPTTSASKDNRIILRERQAVGEAARGRGPVRPQPGPGRRSWRIGTPTPTIPSNVRKAIAYPLYPMIYIYIYMGLKKKQSIFGVGFWHFWLTVIVEGWRWKKED